MVNSKYSKVLTIILVISIIAILGLIIFVGIDWYKAYTANSDASDYLDDFNRIVSNSQSNNDKNNTQVNDVDNNIIEPNININNISNPSGSGNTNTSNASSTKYKGFDVLGRIEIPKTKVDYPILADSGPKALQTSICYLWGPGINEVGNTVLVGHNFRNGTFFSNNSKLVIGDKIYLTDMSGKKVTYKVTHKYTTDSNDFSYAQRDTKGKREISLSTCNNDSTKRVIIWAEEE